MELIIFNAGNTFQYSGMPKLQSSILADYDNLADIYTAYNKFIQILLYNNLEMFIKKYK